MLDVPIPSDDNALLHINRHRKGRGNRNLSVIPPNHSDREEVLVLQATNTPLFAATRTAQEDLGVMPFLKLDGKVLHGNVFVQRFLVVCVADDVLLHRSRMHHGLRHRPQRGKDRWSVCDK